MSVVSTTFALVDVLGFGMWFTLYAAHLDSGNLDTYGHLVPGANVPLVIVSMLLRVKPEAFLQHLTHFRARNFAGAHLT